MVGAGEGVVHKKVVGGSGACPHTPQAASGCGFSFGGGLRWTLVGKSTAGGQPCPVCGLLAEVGNWGFRFVGKRGIIGDETGLPVVTAA